MEDVMNFPCFREVKTVCYMRDSDSYSKGSIPPW
jgi:hypothetical protein